MKALNVLMLFLVSNVIGCASQSEIPIALTDTTARFDRPINFVSDSNETAGVRGNSVVIQRREYLEVKLAALKNEVGDLEALIYGASFREPGGMYGSLKECATKLSDPRIGGNGVVAFSESWQDVTERNDDVAYVLDKHESVMAVSEEGVDARLIRFKKYKSVLTQKYQAMAEKLDSCKYQYRTALISHGLNPSDAEARGEWVDGSEGYKVWQMRRAATNDPEVLAVRKNER